MTKVERLEEYISVVIEENGLSFAHWFHMYECYCHL